MVIERDGKRYELADEELLERTTRIEKDLGDGVTLVAELSTDPNFPEIYVGLERAGVWFQDLVVVGKDYVIKGEEAVFKDNCALYVYGDAKSEDYSWKYLVPILKESDLED